MDSPLMVHLQNQNRSEVRLSRSVALTQVVLFALCAGRVVTDLHRGPLTLEGAIALALLLVLSMPFVAEAVRRKIRGATAGRRARSPLVDTDD